MKFLLAANLSDFGTSPDGQRIKSSQIMAAMKRLQWAQVASIDTSRQRPLFFFRLWRQLAGVHHFFLVPGKRALLATALFLRIYRIFVGSSSPAFHLLVVGGWLPAVSKVGLYRWFLEVFDSISPETFGIGQRLNTRTRRVFVLPNFRIIADELALAENRKSGSLQLGFVSRITRAKGVFDAMELAENLDKRGHQVHLSIYGPIQFEAERDKEVFEQRLAKHRLFVEYRGSLAPEEVMSTLGKFDCLLFPSTYRGEGMPGVIVESLLVGTPVISKKHMFLDDLNSEYDFGFVVAGDYVDEATKILEAQSHTMWANRWDSHTRSSELRKSFGYPAFEAWLHEVLVAAAR